MAEAMINLKVVTVNGGIKVVAVSMAAIVRLARKPINTMSPIFFTNDRPGEVVEQGIEGCYFLLPHPTLRYASAAPVGKPFDKLRRASGRGSGRSFGCSEC